MNDTIRIGGQDVPPGTRVHLELKVARLFTGTWLSLPVAVLNGATAGPRMWLSATIHGDELNGMEIIRRVIRDIHPEELVGTLVAVPVVNVFGFVEQSRYLPDRRDLNRSFPGSAKGSLAARLAHLFVEEVVKKCDYAIDFHTGSLHRSNLPQIRANLKRPETRRLAQAFGAPLMYRSPPIAGSLRQTARNLDVYYLLYEAGEPLRFDEDAINAGMVGTRRVLDALGMWKFNGPAAPASPPFEASHTRWVRANRSGILHLDVELGQMMKKGSLLGEISTDFFSTQSVAVRAPKDGMVIGFTKNPLVNQGDALVHLAMP